MSEWHDLLVGEVKRVRDMLEEIEAAASAALRIHRCAPGTPFVDVVAEMRDLQQFMDLTHQLDRLHTAYANLHRYERQAAYYAGRASDT